MKNWLQSDLGGYIDGNQTGQGLFVFQHIPKTAGSSIVREMQRHIGDYRGVFIDYTNLPAVGGVDDLMMTSLQSVLAEHEATPIKCASGHLRRRHVDHIAETLPDARFQDRRISMGATTPGLALRTQADMRRFPAAIQALRPSLV